MENRKYRSLVEVTSDWIWEVDRDARYTYSSPKVKEILGYQPDEILGRQPFDLMPRSEAVRVRKLFTAILEELRPFSGLENVNLHKNGFEVVLETSGVPIYDEKGEWVGFRGIDRDITERKQAEKLIQRKNNELEEKVAHRTRDLIQREAELEAQNKKMNEMNMALKVLLDQINEEKHEAEKRVLLNIKQLVLPQVEKLKTCNSSSERDTFLEILEFNLYSITSDFSSRLTTELYNLTPSELRVANLIKQGKTTKEISGILHLSTKTISRHRENIRKKLGLVNTRRNLRSVLASMG